MRYLAILAIVGSLCLPVASYGQESWVPFTAKFTETIDNVDSNGNHTVTQYQGVKFQRSDGQQMEQTYYPNSTQLKSGTLSVPKEQVKYSLDYRQQRAIGTTAKTGKIRHAPRTEVIGHENIGGVPATGYYTYDAATKKPVGEIWLADEAPEIVLRTKGVLPNGGSVVNELSSVKIGQEPDISLVQIPEGFSISKP